jgi:hypothetical protein
MSTNWRPLALGATSCAKWTPPAPGFQIRCVPAVGRLKDACHGTRTAEEACEQRRESAVQAQTTEYRRPILRRDAWVAARGGRRLSVARVGAVDSWFLGEHGPRASVVPWRRHPSHRRGRDGGVDLTREGSERNWEEGLGEAAEGACRLPAWGCEWNKGEGEGEASRDCWVDNPSLDGLWVGLPAGPLNILPNFPTTNNLTNTFSLQNY